MRLMMIASYSDSIVSFRGNLVCSLIDQGVDVTVAAPGLTEDSAVSAELRSLGATTACIPLRRTGTNPIQDLWLVFALARLMVETKPEVVLAYTIKPVIYGTIAAWIVRIPKRVALITGLGYLFTGERSGLLGNLARGLYRFALSRSNLVFFQNPDDRALLLDQRVLSADADTCVVNGSGIDVQEYDVAPFRTGPVTFLMIARLLGNKGVREYAGAARQMMLSGMSVRFTLVGWIDENPDSIEQRELDEWVSSGAIDYLGKLDDVRPAIADCSVYVLPSYREGTPRTVLEAMAMGRPIVTTDAPGCRETVVDGENGYLVAVQSQDELIDALRRFVEKPKLISEMGARSRAIAEQKYDVRRVSSIMIEKMGIGQEN